MAEFPDIPVEPDVHPFPSCAASLPTGRTYQCAGSRCAKWVPETRNLNHGAPALREPNEEGTSPTGRGVCADNLRAFPWDDPAGVERG